MSTTSPTPEALLKAAHEGRLDDVRRLLDDGLDVNAYCIDDEAEKEGVTALTMAAGAGHADIVTFTPGDLSGYNMSRRCSSKYI